MKLTKLCGLHFSLFYSLKSIQSIIKEKGTSHRVWCNRSQLEKVLPNILCMLGENGHDDQDDEDTFSFSEYKNLKY